MHDLIVNYPHSRLVEYLHRKIRNAYKLLSRNLREEGHFKDLDTNEGVLKLILKNYSRSFSSDSSGVGFFTVPVVGSFHHNKETSGPIQYG
jgi:hypothetical protein